MAVSGRRAPVDASGELADGTKVNGVVELRKTLLKRPENFVTTVTEKLMIYALGRGWTRATCRSCAQSCGLRTRDNYRLSSLFLALSAARRFA